MSLLASLLPTRWRGGYRATYGPLDDFWYQRDPSWSRSLSGIGVSPDTAMKLSTVWACVTLLADMVGMLPLILYRRLDNEGKERARTHPLFRLLHRQPNERQSAKEWGTMLMGHLLLRGNAYNEIILDGRGAVQRLEPLHPDRMKVQLLPNGRRGYIYRPPSGNERTMTQDEVMHIMGLTLDGIVGCSVIEYARESLGRASAEDAYSATFWSRNAEPPGALVAQNTLTDVQISQMRKGWQEAHSGPTGWHNIAVLSGGVKYEKLGMTNRDAQTVEMRSESAAEIAGRWFRVPPHMVGLTDRSTSWGTGIEQQTLGFVNFTLMPWLVSIEQACDRDLIQDDGLFAEFLVDALLRGDMASRAQAYSVYVQNGIMSENEVRVRENLNPYPGLDVPERSSNQGRTSTAPADQTPAPRRLQAVPPEDDEEDEAARLPVNGNGHARAIVLRAAQRMVRKEIAAITRWAPRYASDPAGWRAWVSDFYAKHEAALIEALGFTSTQAAQYGAQHEHALLTHGLTVLEEWDTHQAEALVALALMEVSTHGG